MFCVSTAEFSYYDANVKCVSENRFLNGSKLLVCVTGSDSSD